MCGKYEILIETGTFTFVHNTTKWKEEKGNKNKIIWVYRLLMVHSFAYLCQ